MLLSHKATTGNRFGARNAAGNVSLQAKVKQGRNPVQPKFLFNSSGRSKLFLFSYQIVVAAALDHCFLSHRVTLISLRWKEAAGSSAPPVSVLDSSMSRGADKHSKSRK